MAKPRITDLDLADFERLAQASGQPAYRGRQAHEWVISRGVVVPGEMRNLPKAFRLHLEEVTECAALGAEWSRDERSTTEKLLLRLSDGELVESVLICEGDRTTVCLSSQAGCPVACLFCASGQDGLSRNLSRGEIVEQFQALQRRASELGRRIGNAVMMGMGEPMLNLPNVLSALRVLNDPKGGGIGARHLTLSSVGLKKGIDRLREEGRQYTLAFSLHAPDDALRRELIPFDGALSIDELVEAARGYLQDTGREVTFEYVLLDGVNASPSQAFRLAERLRGVRCTLNLIPYNENPGLPYRRPNPRQVDHFAQILRDRRVKVTVRKQKGDAISAACGQLRRRAQGG